MASRMYICTYTSRARAEKELVLYGGKKESSIERDSLRGIRCSYMRAGVVVVDHEMSVVYVIIVLKII